MSASSRLVAAVGAVLAAVVFVLCLTGTANAAPGPYPTGSPSSGVGAVSAGASGSSPSFGVDPTSAAADPGSGNDAGGAGTSGGTASTGVAVIGIGVLALALIFGGTVLMVTSRRRRHA